LYRQVFLYGVEWRDQI
jgi:hypothetical protein